MLVAFSCNGLSLDSPFDSRFGRCPYFLVYDTEQDTNAIIDNHENTNAEHGAGIATASRLSSEKVNVVVTGHTGPKATQALKSAGIAVYTCEAPTCKKALELFQEGALLKQ